MNHLPARNIKLYFQFLSCEVIIFIFCQLLTEKILLANSEDPAASDLVLHCLPGLGCTSPDINRSKEITQTMQ